MIDFSVWASAPAGTSSLPANRASTHNDTRDGGELAEERREQRAVPAADVHTV